MTPPHDAQLEIERAFLLDRLPELPEHAVAYRIEQGYLSGRAESPDANAAREGRIRRQVAPDGAQSFIMTVKSGLGIARVESEHAITESEFRDLWLATVDRRIVKTRYRVTESCGGQSIVWEIDEFDDLDLVLAEVELAREDFPLELPAWLEPHVVREVTEEPKYRNYELALRAVRAVRGDA